MKMVITHLVLMAYLTGVSNAQETSTADTSEIDTTQLRRFLQQGYASANDVLKDVKFIFEKKVARDPDWLKKIGYENKEPYYHAYEYIARNGKERFADLYKGAVASDNNVGLRAEFIGKERTINFAVFDGQSRLGYAPIQDDSTNVGRATLKTDYNSLVNTHREISKILGVEPGLLPDNVLANSEAVIESQPEQVNGLLAYKVSCPVEINKEALKLTYWLCPDRSCLPVRAEMRKMDGSLYKQMDVKEFMQIEDGTWVIKRVIHKPFAQRDGQPWELGADEYTVKDIKLNPQVDEGKIFSMSADHLPEGTLVQDLILGLQYTAGEGPVSSKRLTEIIEDAIEEIPFGLEPTADKQVDSLADPTEMPDDTTPSAETASKPLFARTGVIPTVENKEEKSYISGGIAIAVGALIMLAIAGIWRQNRRRSKMLSILSVLVVSALSAPSAQAEMQLESWQSCCGAVCLHTVAGLLGTQTDLAELREQVKPNSRGETTLAQIAETAEKMGFYTAGLRVKSEKVEEFSVPIIAHKPPDHFVVFLGLGKGKGVTIIDPPRKARQMTDKILNEQEYWHVVAVSKSPISVDGIGTSNGNSGNSSSRQKPDTAVFHGPLRFDDTQWYFGDINPGITKEHVFSFKNKGNHVVTLSKVKSSCPCVKVLNYTEILEPGQKGTVDIVFDSTGMLGYMAKQVFGTIHQEDMEKDEIFFLDVTGEVSRRGVLVIKPRRLYLPDVVKGAVVSQTVTLKRIGYDHLYLKEIRPDSPSISANVLEGTGSDAYEAQIQLNVKAEGDIGPFEHQVVFETDFPDHPTVTLPVYGNIVSHIKAEPAALFMGLVAGDKPLKQSVTLTSRTGIPFEVKAAASDIETIKTTVSPENNEKTAWVITLTGNTELPNGIMNGKISVETDDPDISVIDIPFTGLVMAKQ